MIEISEKFNKQELMQALGANGLPSDLDKILSAMADDVIGITEEIQIKKKLNETSAHVMKMRAEILSKMASIINESRTSNKLDLKSEEVQLLLSYILTTLKKVSDDFFIQNKYTKAQSDNLYLFFADALENWESKFEIFKASNSCKV